MNQSNKVTAQTLTKEGFIQFGQVIEKQGSENFLINNDKCTRHHALAECAFTGENGAIGVSIFSGTPYDLPLTLNMVERHPLGSQAFYPLGDRPWLVIACADENGSPGEPHVFLASANQGINLKPNTWHGVLTPLEKPSDFLVVDRIGEGKNLEEYFFDQPYSVTL